MTDPYRIMCAVLLADYDNCHYRSELSDRARALLDQPEPEGPTDEELDKSFQQWWYEEGSIGPFGMDHEEHTKLISQIAWHNGAYVARLGRDTPDTESLRSALRECGRAAGAFISDECSDEFLLQIPAEVRLAFAKPVWDDIHYAWELHDDEGEWQAGGSAITLESAEREGNRYLQTYAQDGPHKLIIERHCVNIIEEMANG